MKGSGVRVYLLEGNSHRPPYSSAVCEHSKKQAGLNPISLMCYFSTCKELDCFLVTWDGGKVFPDHPLQLQSGGAVHSSPAGFDQGEGAIRAHFPTPG